MKVKSFAKINLGLEIVAKRKDGYHEIRTIFQSIHLFDILKFQEVEEERIILSGSDKSILWNESNLIFKTAYFLKENFSIKKGLKIEVEKNIPSGKGLGGGSSNAAMTFLALKKLWNLPTDRKNLINYAKNLGADIPYFFWGGMALGLNRGDKIHPLENEKTYYVLLIFPEFSIPTKEIYTHWDELTLTSKSKESKIYKFLKERKFSSLENDLEKAIFNLYPELREIKKALLKKGAELAMVSGSGSSVYGIFYNEHKAMETLAEFERESLQCMVVPTISKDKYWAEIGNL